MEKFNINERLAQVVKLVSSGDNVGFKVTYMGTDITVEVMCENGTIAIECGEGCSIDPLEAIIKASQRKLSYLSQSEVDRLAMCAWHMAADFPVNVELVNNAIFLEIDNNRSTTLSLINIEGTYYLAAEFAGSEARYLFPSSHRASYGTYLDDVIALYRKIQKESD